jgi:hypothetical protein
MARQRTLENFFSFLGKTRSHRLPSEAMDPYLPHGDLADYSRQGNEILWYGLESQANNRVDGIDINCDILTQVTDATAHPFQTTPSSFSPSPHFTDTTFPDFLLDAQQAHIRLPLLGNINSPSPYDSRGMSDGQYPLVEENASGLIPMLMPTSTTMPPSMFPSATAPSTSQDQQAKFACGVCSRAFNIRSRAETCQFNHVGIKPFVCNGACGLVDW